MKVVKCRCNSLPSHFQTHKAGPNCGRWFYTVSIYIDLINKYM